MSNSLPRIIAALQIPPFRNGPRWSNAWYEDYVLENTRVFVENGVQSIKLQDETREPGPATPETVARTTALALAIRRNYPDVTLGIIVQAHDAESPLAIAAAVDAAFIRLKVFVGASMTSEGIREALALQAVDFRAAIGRTDIHLMTDVHDRTSVPMVPVEQPFAARWAQSLGADEVVITGSSFSDTLERVAAVRAAGVRVPIVIGGGVDSGNVRDALKAADHIVVSSALRKRGAKEDDIVQWDAAAVAAFMEAAAE